MTAKWLTSNSSDPSKATITIEIQNDQRRLTGRRCAINICSSFRSSIVPHRQRWIWAALAAGAAALIGLGVFVIDWSQFNYVDETVELVVLPPEE